MSKELLINMYYAAPELWYVNFGIFLCFLFIILVIYYKLSLVKKQNFSLKRTEERYSETINAAHDGYYIFIYPDDRIEDAPQEIIEKCSRRLAVMLSLPNGIDSNLNEVLKYFYKDDIDKINKYIALLKEDAVSFEDKFSLKNGKTFNLSGARISGADGSKYGDIIWFRDISNDSYFINNLISQQNQLQKRLLDLENLLDNLPYPVWLRDADLNLVATNKKYTEFLTANDKNRPEATNNDSENNNEESTIKKIAIQAQKNNHSQVCKIHRNRNGRHFCYEAIEIPFHTQDSLDKIATVGTLRDISEFDELSHSVKQHQNAHLEILGALGTAFAVFDDKFKLLFYNSAFKQLWNFDDEWLSSNHTYGNFLDSLRERRLIMEVPDYPYFKNEEQKMFSKIIEPKEDLIHLPDGRSLRRVRAPYLHGGLVFAYEDISDRLAARREYNLLINVQQEILNKISDAILIFGSNGRLTFYNQAYLDLWELKDEQLSNGITFNDLLEMLRQHFNDATNWSAFKKEIFNYLFSNNTQAFSIKRNGGDTIECFSTLLANESIMVTMRKTQNS